MTVTAPDADCNPRYGANARIQVIVTDGKGVEAINTTTPMTDAGGFTRAAGATVKSKAASCAMPVESLSITR